MSRYLIVDYERSSFSVSQNNWSEDIMPQIVPLSSMTDNAIGKSAQMSCTNYNYTSHSLVMDVGLITGIIVAALLACTLVALPIVTYSFKRYRYQLATLHSFAGVNSYTKEFFIRKTRTFVDRHLVLSRGKSEMNISEGSNAPSRPFLKWRSLSSRLRMHWLNGKRYTCINKLRLYVESWSGEAWDWWPLCPSFEQLEGDESRLKWHYPSKPSTLSQSRHAEVPKSFGHEDWTVLEKAIQQSTAYEGDLSQSQSNSEQSRANSAITRGLPLERPFRAHSKGNSTYCSDIDDFSKKGMDPSAPITAVDIVPPSNFTGFVLFGVYGSQRLQNAYLRLAQIDVFDKDDDGFFDQMIFEFRRLRGFLRRTFSIWVFHTCEFITVRLSDRP